MTENIVSIKGLWICRALHAVLEDINLELAAGDFLLLDGQDLPDAMRRIHDEFVGLEALSLGRLLRNHSLRYSLRRIRLRSAGRLGHGSHPADGAAGSLRGSPALRRRGFADGLFGPVTSFSCHCFRVVLTPLLTVSPETRRKNMLPWGSARSDVHSLYWAYNTFLAEIKALRCTARTIPRPRPRKSTTSVNPRPPSRVPIRINHRYPGPARRRRAYRACRPTPWRPPGALS